ncbi:sulfide:quinone oxidoreductase, mitochondrial [Plakobranchus ocellatus]|uniref:Sulfide:quinone oxidoreductase, mitochondrial n=1 Tax=Plakobranchus ocellatus TaxID=259542 RepID=A0AAV4DX04_9GAST|nr:sulfide:quinone oxidoreductase, mitochondrial [Plakobranchus ocellatus]
MALRNITKLTVCNWSRHHQATVVKLKAQKLTPIVQACFYSNKEAVPRPSQANSSYKVLVVGGGSGGNAVAAKFASLGKKCAVVEPSDMHYYQPLWTLVGAGLKGFQASAEPTRKVLPSSVDWIRDKAVKFDPQNNTVELGSGEKVQYDYLVVALGIQLDYHKIDGLLEALEKDPAVVSNYHPRWVNKTFPAMQDFKGGNAIFTFPNTPIKCAGAPQKIMYLAEEFFRKDDYVVLGLYRVMMTIITVVMTMMKMAVTMMIKWCDIDGDNDEYRESGDDDEGDDDDIDDEGCSMIMMPMKWIMEIMNNDGENSDDDDK